MHDLALKFNPNHDELGRFTFSGTGTIFGGRDDVHLSGSMKEFAKTAHDLYKAQGVQDWEASNNMFAIAGPLTYFGTSRSWEINRFLRNDRKVDVRDSAQTLSDWVDRVNDSFAHFGVDVADGTELYRGVGDSDSPMVKALEEMKEGDTFRDMGFVSTTTAVPNSMNFGRNVLQITVKGKHKVLLFKREAEVLFQNGRKFKYLGKSQGHGTFDGFTFYRVEMS